MEATTQQQLIKNYEVVRVMGEGSFGKVFLVRNVHTFNQYAMKKYSYYHLKKNGKDLSLQRSVKILKSLNHKNILKIVKYIITKDDSIYLFFESCKKGNLQRTTPLLKKASQKILIDFVIFQLVEGLKYLKSVSVAHRDLKPSNIAFNNQGQLKIIDFDQAVCFNPIYVSQQSMKLPEFPEASDNPIYVSRRSRAMSYVGTYTYMSPQMRSKTQSDQRADIWALGCIIYEIFMNQSIFVDFQQEKELVEEVKSKLNIMKNQPLTEGYRELLEKILTINPNERISIEEIYNDPIFKKLRESPQYYENSRKRFKKLLRGNYSIPNPKTLHDALTFDLIGMKAGRQIFEKLKTVVMVSKNYSYDLRYLVGGGQYFKLRDIKDQTSKKYIFYDQIQTIKIINQFIVITIVVEKWSHSSDKKNQQIHIKHIYQDQTMLGRLYDLMIQIYND